MTRESRKRKLLPGKMILWAVLLFAAVFLLSPVRGSAKKKVKIKVSKTRIICNVGYVGKIKTRVKTSPKKWKKKIKLKFKSSNKKVLIVNNKGQFKALTPGMAVVTVKAVRKKKTLAKKKIIIAVNERPKKKAKSKKSKKGSYFTLKKTKIICDVGNAGKIKPKNLKKNIKLKYESSNTQILKVNAKGEYKAISPGISNVTVKAVKDKKTVAKKKVRIAINGLCTSDMSMDEGHFIYNGRKYLPGTLPVNIEKKLCLTQKDLKVYLQKYLAVYQKKISDPVEAGLTAIMNFSAFHMKAKVVPDGSTSSRAKPDNFVFDGAYLGTIEDAQTIWVSLLMEHKGACVYYSSLFSYLCYLSGVPCMQVEDAGHDWNLIYHPKTNAYYNLENHNLMVTRESHFVAPPITKNTAKILDGKIIDSTYTLPRAKMPVKKITNMGRNVSEVCPLLMAEKKGSQFRVFFKKLKKGSVPTFSDGKKVKASQIIYRNLDYDLKNENIVPKFNEANKVLHKDLKKILP